MNVKQVIVIRTKYPDGKGGYFGLRKGKECAQAAHASALWLIKRIASGKPFTTAEKVWMDGDFAKIVLQVNSEDELNQIFASATEAGLTVEMITDLGKTEFGGVPTKTCLAIGPEETEKIDPITKHLKLY